LIRKFARPYARAMMEILPDLAEAEKVHAELSAFEEARHSSSELAALFDNPGVDVNNKIAIIRSIAARLKLSDMAVKLLEVLLRNHRLNQLGSVLDAWKASINKAAGIAVASVKSAHPLSEEEQARLRKSLETKLGRRVDLRLSVDPSLLGGFVAEVESEVYDASVVGRIERFRETLR